MISAGQSEACKALSGGEWIIVKRQGDRHLNLGSWKKSHPVFCLLCYFTDKCYSHKISGTRNFFLFLAYDV